MENMVSVAPTYLWITIVDVLFSILADYSFNFSTLSLDPHKKSSDVTNII